MIEAIAILAISIAINLNVYLIVKAATLVAMEEFYGEDDIYGDDDDYEN